MHIHSASASKTLRKHVKHAGSHKRRRSSTSTGPCGLDIVITSNFQEDNKSSDVIDVFCLTRASELRCRSLPCVFYEDFEESCLKIQDLDEKQSTPDSCGLEPLIFPYERQQPRFLSQNLWTGLDLPGPALEPDLPWTP